MQIRILVSLYKVVSFSSPTLVLLHYKKNSTKQQQQHTHTHTHVCSLSLSQLFMHPPHYSTTEEDGEEEGVVETAVRIASKLAHKS